MLWVGLVVVLLLVVGLVSWGLRGIADRAHEPGTRHLD